MIKDITAKAGLQWRKLTNTLRPSDAVNVHNLYKIKGCSDLHIQASRVSRAKTVCMVNWLTGKKKTMRTESVFSLGTFQIAKTDGTMEKLDAVFDRLFSVFGDRQLDHNALTLTDLCPDYVEGQFKHYHVKQVVAWYNQVLARVSDKKQAA